MHENAPAERAETCWLYFVDCVEVVMHESLDSRQIAARLKIQHDSFVRRFVRNAHRPEAVDLHSRIIWPRPSSGTAFRKAQES